MRERTNEGRWTIAVLAALALAWVACGQQSGDAAARTAKDAAAESDLRRHLHVTVSMFTRTTAAKTGADILKFKADEPAKEKEKKGKEDK